MILFCHNMLAGQRSAVTVSSDTITIGRGSHNQLVLESPLIAFEAAVLQRIDDAWFVKPLGKNGCRMADRQIAKGEQVELAATKRIELFPFEITLETAAAEIPTSDPNDDRATAMLCSIHRKLLAVMDVETEDTQRRDNPEYQLNLEHMIEQLAVEESIADAENIELVRHIAGLSVRQSLIESVFETSGTLTSTLSTDGVGWSRFVSAVSHRERDLADVVERLSSSMGLQASNDLSEQMETIDRCFQAAWDIESSRLLHDFLLYLAIRSLKKQSKILCLAMDL